MGKLYHLKIDERKDVWLKTATQSNFKKEYRHHPSCKPMAVITKIILGGTEEGDLILDPFAGSGTTLVSAKLLGRKATGIEISEKYCQIAIERLQHTKMQLSIKEVV